MTIIINKYIVYCNQRYNLFINYYELFCYFILNIEFIICLLLVCLLFCFDFSIQFCLFCLSLFSQFLDFSIFLSLFVFSLVYYGIYGMNKSENLFNFGEGHLSCSCIDIHDISPYELNVP